MYGADPRLAALGSKTGCRRLFGEVGVPYPLGAEDLHSLDEVADAIGGILATRPTAGQVIVKLNEGVSGAGNALVDLAGIAALPRPERRAAILERVAAMQLESPDVPFEAYVAKLESDGGIVEERIVGEELLSPSVQLRVLPGGTVELLSTHDQLLGGASGQSYLGCTFPADPAYSRLISEPATAIGERLSSGGRHRSLRGRLRRRPGCRGGLVGVRDRTEPPQGRHDASVPDPAVPDRRQVRGGIRADSSRPTAPRSTSWPRITSSPTTLRALSIGDLFDVVARHGLHFDQSRQVGHRLPHDQLDHRARTGGDDGRRRHAGAGDAAVRPGPGGPARRSPGRG